MTFLIVAGLLLCVLLLGAGIVWYRAKKGDGLEPSGEGMPGSEQDKPFGERTPNEHDVEVLLAHSLTIRMAKAIGTVPNTQERGGGPPPHPCVWQTADGHPEVADTGRVQLHEGEGEVLLRWQGLDLHKRGDAGHFLLQVTFVRPISTTFTVDFPARQWRSLIELILKTHEVTVLTAAPHDWAQLDLPSMQPLYPFFREKGADHTPCGTRSPSRHQAG